MHHEVLTKEGLELFPKLSTFDGFYLAGGTGLALQIGHRVSVDFDLFTNEEISRNLLAKVTTVFQGYSVKPVVNNRDELTVFVDDVKVTFLSYPFPIIDPFVDSDGIRMLSIGEIGATKAYTIGRRGAYKDYVDLYFILAGRHASLSEIVAKAENKFGESFNSRLVAEQLLFMDDVNDYKIDFLGSPVMPKEILDRFKQEIQKLGL